MIYFFEGEGGVETHRARTTLKQRFPTCSTRTPSLPRVQGGSLESTKNYIDYGGKRQKRVYLYEKLYFNIYLYINNKFYPHDFLEYH